MYKLGLLGSVRSRASLVLRSLRAEYLVRAQAVHRCRGLPCGAGEEIVWRSRGVAYSVVLAEIWYILVECSTRTLYIARQPDCDGWFVSALSMFGLLSLSLFLDGTRTKRVG